MAPSRRTAATTEQEGLGRVMALTGPTSFWRAPGLRSGTQWTVSGSSSTRDLIPGRKSLIQVISHHLQPRQSQHPSRCRLQTRLSSSISNNSSKWLPLSWLTSSNQLECPLSLCHQLVDESELNLIKLRRLKTLMKSIIIFSRVKILYHSPI